MKDLWFEYFEQCEFDGVECTHEGFQDSLFDKADIALGDE